MKKVTFILFLLLVLITQIFAVNASRLSGDKLNVSAFCCDSTETIMLLGLSGGGLWRSDDGGFTWEPKRHDIAGDYWGFMVRDLFMLDAAGDTVFAKVQVTGSSSYWQYAISIDGGETWRRLYPESNANHDHHLVIDKTNRSKLMHIDSRNISVSEDFGYTWEDWIHDPNQNQNSGLCQDPENTNVFYMSGFAPAPNEPGGIFKSNDYGRTWNPQINPSILEYNTLYLSDVIVLSNGDVLSSIQVGVVTWEPFQSVFENRMIRGTESGSNWQVEDVQLPYEYQPWEIIESSRNPGTVIVLGEYRFCVGGKQLYRSTDYGHTFTQIENGPPASVVKFFQNEHSDVIYVCTGNEGVYRSEDAGLNWTQMDLAIDVTMWREYAIKEDVISTALYGYSDSMTIYDKINGTLRELAYPEVGDDESYMHKDLIIDDNRYYGFLLKHDIANTMDIVQPVLSENEGESWSYFGDTVCYESNRMMIETDIFEGEDICRFIYLSRPDVGFDVAVTIDTGRTWIQSHFEGALYTTDKMFMQTEESIYLLIPYIGIFVSNNNGTEWQEMDFPSMDDLNSTDLFLMKNETNENIFLFGHARVWEWSDNEWRDCGSSLADAGNLENIGIIPGDTPRFLGTYESRNFLWYKNSPEENWERIEFDGEYISELNNIFDPQYDPELDRVYISTHLGLYWFDVAQLDVKDQPITLYPMDYEVLKTYPNPFNASTKIEFILELPGDVSLKLYDINGRLVRELLDEKRQAGQHTLNLDGNQLASGTYFLKMDNGHQILSKKLVLIK